MSVLNMLTLLTEVVGSVNLAVEHLEAGDQTAGLAGLNDCIARLEGRLDSLGGNDVDVLDVAVPLEEVRGELNAVLEDLRAARSALIAAYQARER